MMWAGVATMIASHAMSARGALLLASTGALAGPFIVGVAVARTIGSAISPLFVGFMFARPALINLPFFIAGTLKIVYDLLLYRAFNALRPPEE